MIALPSTLVASFTWISKNKCENFLSIFEKSTAWLNLKAYNGSLCNLKACEAEIFAHSSFKAKWLTTPANSASFIGGFNSDSDLSLSNWAR
ncbi:hypothetical protein MFC_01461 [Mesomycoplasma flocculare ATCC 27716]|nr:hypothetical protein MFC_01461 [Mesomycoplasma flocculare ATCC 27716]